MKKLLKISFLMAILCFAVPVYADGDMPTGTKTCTQNCGGLYNGTTSPTVSDDKNLDDSSIGEIYSWIYKQISELVD
ncbi:MAG TPA: hypothetical protein VNB22_08395 [Pyrinomonadaceae bacterium]|jgi:hypothetical protein|nr:hypothetical protein [Pyrinomonadaceae bacterium]